MRVIVIGAGVIGSAIAWRLARAGAQVTVVDPAPGHGASRAAAGMLTPVGEAWHGERDLATLLLDSARRYPRFVQDVAASSGGDTGYRTTQTLICGADGADRQALAELHDLATRTGLRTEPLTLREARRIEPALAPRLACAYLAPDDHQVDPRALCAALLAGLRADGGALVQAEATEVLADSRSVRLADGRSLDADAIVLANALGATPLWPALGGLRAVYGDIARLAPALDLPPLLQGVVRGLVGGHSVYLVPRADGSVVLGATMRENGDSRVSVGGVHELLRDAATIVPGVVDLAVEEIIARPRPGTPDNLPLLGEVAPGVVAATGFHRHGVLLAPLAADAVASTLGIPVDDLPDLDACAPTRFALQESR
ncbi:glycine oxidase ThiO [Calidifontibacter sp. DB0510]|uniref:glycine oxidase n=1 Tax=Metallococcus carri TaxID=1656884 RepID=A0A967EBH8_9MICO|nr:glycine oxidase ThiO [Metallococcus carri]NHN57330.1 glycine oxidase ThiO [Metallococcus carri]NOP38065.1 glycine oxidase ThiO [Calidifontibacter sp. DB2511S]